MFVDSRLWRLAAGFHGRIALAALVGLLTVPVAILRLTLSGQTIARVFRGASLSELWDLLALIATMVLLRAAIQFAREQIASRMGAGLKLKFRRMLYDRALLLGPSYFDQQRTGDMSNSLVEDVERLEIYFAQYLPQLAIAALTPLILFAFMLALDLEIAIVFLVSAVATILLPSIYRRATRRVTGEYRREFGSLSADFLDNMQGLATLKAFGVSRQWGDRLAERVTRMFERTMAVMGVNLLTGSLTLFGASAGAAAALIVGALRVQEGTLPLATLPVILLLGVEVFRPLRDLATVAHNGMLAMASAQGLFKLLDAVPSVREPEQPLEGGQLEPSVAFEQVTFSYRGDRPAVSDVSFELHPGETLGVVGASGAGKSTMVNLMLRFIDAQDGHVLVGGKNVRDLPLDTLRRQVSLVAQDTYLFYGTVADNLRMGKPGATGSELEAAARMANAHEFIAELPNGYNTLIGERGLRLSGGQRQRIAIARALLRDAPILVLDEALSSVDAENEALIREALDRLQRGRTTLVIAHRLSSVIDANRIIVLDDGRIVETGAHAELMALGGMYSRLMAAQQAVEAQRQSEGFLQAEPEEEPAVAQGATAAADSVPARTPGVWAIWGRLLRLVRPWLGETLATLGLGVGNAVANAALAIVGALIVTRVATHQEVGSLLWLLAGVALAAGLLRWLDGWLSHDLAYRLLGALRIRLYKLLDPLAPAYLLRRRSGDLVSAAMSDIETIELFYAHTISPGFVAVVIPGGILVVLALLSWPLALTLLPFVIAVALTPQIGSKRVEQLGQALRDLTGEVNAHMVDSLQGLRTIVAFNHGEGRAADIQRVSSRLSAAKQRFTRWQSFQAALVDSLIGLGSLAVLTMGARLVSQGHMGRYDLPLVAVLAMSSFMPVIAIVTVARELMQTLAAGRRYFAIEDEPVPVTDGPGATIVVDRASPGLPVSFSAVTFRYNATDRPALEKVSFEMPAGGTVALVGRSGAGKSTVANLLLRFWDPQAGEVRIDGRDIRELKLDELRRLIALVGQDTYLFHTSLRDNIRLGRPEASDAEVLTAARGANVDEFAAALPDGYDTFVGERGMQLSGGQRQRVSIARAILKDAPILVLDEATSHLDALNEADVHEALTRLMAGRTTLVIAHRLSTIRSADRIVVLDSGRALEQGTHAELLARDGLYSHLIASQLMPAVRSSLETATTGAQT